nr:fimbria/pilus periplasmic chaperone [Pseudomonas aeruginosa]
MDVDPAQRPAGAAGAACRPKPAQGQGVTVLANILDIPRNPRQTDTRQFAIRKRLKLFYRPARLSQ